MFTRGISMARPRNVRKRARRDANHNDIVRVFEDLGCSWFDTSAISGGLDGLLGVSGIDQRVEIKNPNALRGKKQALRLTGDEKDEFERWKGRPPVVITTQEEAIDLVNKLRREAACTNGHTKTRSTLTTGDYIFPPGPDT
jgi:hypothetical protein